MSIDAAVQARGLRPTTPRTKRPYVIADRGYTPQGTFNHDLTARGYSVLMRYQKNHKTTHDLAEASEDHPTAPGPWLYRGAILCPAAGRLLNDRRTTPPAPGEKDANVLMAHARQEALLNALKCPSTATRRRPPSAHPGAPPRPHEPKPLPVRLRSKSAAPQTPDVSAAPSSEPTTTWTRTWQTKTDVGRNAPGHNPPLVCRQAYTTLTFKEEKKRKNSNSEELTSDFPVFKQWQPIREGTWEHGDWMANVRSPDEASTRDSSHPAEVHEPPAKLWHAETPS